MLPWIDIWKPQLLANASCERFNLTSVICMQGLNIPTPCFLPVRLLAVPSNRYNLRWLPLRIFQSISWENWTWAKILQMHRVHISNTVQNAHEDVNDVIFEMIAEVHMQYSITMCCGQFLHCTFNENLRFNCFFAGALAMMQHCAGRVYIAGSLFLLDLIKSKDACAGLGL